MTVSIYHPCIGIVFKEPMCINISLYHKKSLQRLDMILVLVIPSLVSSLRIYVKEVQEDYVSNGINFSPNHSELFQNLVKQKLKQTQLSYTFLQNRTLTANIPHHAYLVSF